jgi:hypothetical protein
MLVVNFYDSFKSQNWDVQVSFEGGVVASKTFVTEVLTVTF